jgi:phenylalanyl-tRNA synthetase alpha chain
MTLAELDALQQQSLTELQAAADAAALEQVRVRYLGRNGLLPALMKQLKDVPAADRPEFGRRANAWRAALESTLTERQAAAAPREAVAPFDTSLPGRWPTLGAMHPVSRVIEEVCRVFARLGFTVADGPDIETRFNNFTALNTPAHHPSLDATDTFWLGEDQLLRTQTSPCASSPPAAATAATPPTPRTAPTSTRSKGSTWIPSRSRWPT